MIDTCRCGFCGAILPNLAEAAQARNAELEAKVGELEQMLARQHGSHGDQPYYVGGELYEATNAALSGSPALVGEVDAELRDEIVEHLKPKVAALLEAQQAVVDAAMEERALWLGPCLPQKTDLVRAKAKRVEACDAYAKLREPEQEAEG